MSLALRAAPAEITAAWRSAEIDTPARGGSDRRDGRITGQPTFHPAQHARELGVGDGLVPCVNDDRQAVASESVEVLVDLRSRVDGLGAGRLPTGSRQCLLGARREDAEADRDDDPRRRDDAEVRGGPATEPPDGSELWTIGAHFDVS